MSGFLDGIGEVLKKLMNWVPSKKESKINELTKLLKENDEIQRHHPLSAIDAGRYARNADRIKQLRGEIDAIGRT